MLFHEFIHVYQKTQVDYLMGLSPEQKGEREFIAYYFTFFPNDKDAFIQIFPNVNFTGVFKDVKFDDDNIVLFKQSAQRFYSDMSLEKQNAYKLYLLRFNTQMQLLGV